MHIKERQFITTTVDIFKKLLLYLWKKEIVVVGFYTFPQDNFDYVMEFELDSGKSIGMKMKIEFNELNCVEKMGIVYEQIIDEEEKIFLALSFLYNAPYELELCNQYGLFSTKDVNNMDNKKKIKQIDNKHNLLGENQFYIFNMSKINNGCRDKQMEEILYDIHYLCSGINELSSK